MENLPIWVDSIIRSFEVALAHGSFYSILIGWVVAIGVTQWVKNLPFYPTNKHWIRACAAPIGTIVTFLLWPDAGWGKLKILTAIAAGVSSPWVYWLITRVIYRFWPGAEKHLSAEPRPHNPSDL